MSRLTLPTLVAAGLVLAAGPVLASGSYVGGPPRVPARVDTSRYELGKTIFNGKANLAAATADAKARQTPRLNELQAKLPKGVQKTTQLGELAGKLSTEQLAALEYFLEVRFNAK